MGKKAKKKSWEVPGFGWDPASGEKHGVEEEPKLNGMGRRREVQNRLGISTEGGGSMLDRAPINVMPQRVTPTAIKTPSYYVVRDGKTIPVYDEDEDLGLYNAGSYYGDSYYSRYGFGQQQLGYGGHKHLSDEERERAGRYKEGLGDSFDSWESGRADYKKTGVWGGYNAYRTPTLSYRYVEQMANVLAAHYDITITSGDAWEVDIKNKKLTYNPLSLISGTKADLLLTLLHEIGHIINTTPNDEIKGGDPFIYKDPVGKALFEIPSIFEDMRNDAIMQKTYDGAQEIYDTAQEPPIRALAARMFKVAEQVRQFWIQEEARFLEEMNATMLSMKQNMIANPADEAKIKKSIVSIIDDAFRVTKDDDIKEIVGRYQSVVIEPEADRQKRSELPNAFDYAGHMLLHAYGFNVEKHDKLARKYEEEIKPYLESTEGYLPTLKTAPSTQDLFDFMQVEVTPKIKDLLDRVQFPPSLGESLSGKAKAKMRANMAQRMQSNQETQSAGQQQMRANGGSGPGDRLPSDWLEGDYNSLRDSVKNEIKTLDRFMQNIRREEQTIKMTRNEKRGKLDSRALYKFATGSTRLFKRKLPNIDTVRSFAFSVVVDTSGSMQGNRIVNSTRAMIAFAEAFERVGIPMEIMRFDNDASIIKPFDVERMDKKQKDKIGGLVKAAGGATNIKYVFEKTELLKRPERNKILIVITDGGVGDPAYIKREYIDKFKQQGVQTYGFALEGDERDIEMLCEQGKGFNLTSTTQMIPHFTDLLKKLMRTARGETSRVNQ